MKSLFQHGKDWFVHLPRSKGQSPCSKCIEKYHPRRQIFDQSKDSTYECECEVPVVHSEEKYLLRHWNDIGNFYRFLAFCYIGGPDRTVQIHVMAR